ncbi:hypothetical protein VNI00_010160 [Paramarasmius palmivorus]|uniref:Uncharacterized protein n=1 Tax=Paramarasmius palmivorus TaxID=297713 RepID=A0AAW0CJS9_9AGAR
MVHFASFKLFALVSAACVLQASAGSLVSRQAADCPELALGIEHSVDAVKDLASVSNDPAVAKAQSALQSAQEGSNANQALLNAGQALDSIETDDANVDDAVQDALDEVATAQQAAEKCSNGTQKKLSKRQIGNLQCNIARLQTVRNLGATADNVDAIAAAAGSDPEAASAAQSAQTALSSSQDGIGQIAQAIITGQQAPAAARDQVGQGFADAKSALDSISSTDPNVMSSVSAAQASLDKAISAGQDVVSNCK